MQVLDKKQLNYTRSNLKTQGKINTMNKRELKKNSTSFIQRLLNQDLKTLIIQAGFPYYKSPHLYQGRYIILCHALSGLNIISAHNPRALP